MDENEKQAYIERALALHKSGYNCAQSVACSFADRTDVDEDTLFRLMEGLGGGMGGFSETCGAISGAVAVLGYQTSEGGGNTKTKGRTYKRVRTIVSDFQDKNGSTLCKELKGLTGGPVLRTCPGCIADACSLLADALEPESHAEEN